MRGIIVSRAPAKSSWLKIRFLYLRKHFYSVSITCKILIPLRMMLTWRGWWANYFRPTILPLPQRQSIAIINQALCSKCRCPGGNIKYISLLLSMLSSAIGGIYCFAAWETAKPSGNRSDWRYRLNRLALRYDRASLPISPWAIAPVAVR